MTNCTVFDNWAGHEGGGTYSRDNSPVLTNSIFWGNSDGGPPYEFDQVRHYATEGELVINFSCVQNWTGAFGGVGNTGDNPWLTAAGRLSPGSSCIDAGSNAALPADFLDLNGNGDTAEPLPFDLDGAPRLVGDPCAIGVTVQPVDMGAYEFQDVTPSYPIGDFTGDCYVGIDDFLLLLGSWGPCPPSSCPADLDGSGDVGISDFLVFMYYWGL